MKYLITESSRFKSLKVIKEITSIISERSADDFIDLAEYEPESSPTIGENDGDWHQVEAVYLDKVFITVYNDDGMALDEYFLEYEEIELDVLENILDIIEEEPV